MTAALKVVQPLPSDSFLCEHYRCTLSARDCVARQRTRGEWKGESHGRRFHKTFVPLRLQFCASGKCEQGKKIAAKVAQAPGREEVV